MAGLLQEGANKTHLWTAILPCLNVISEVLAGPASIAKVDYLAFSSQQPCLKRQRHSFLVIRRLPDCRLINCSICGNKVASGDDDADPYVYMHT